MFVCGTDVMRCVVDGERDGDGVGDAICIARACVDTCDGWQHLVVHIRIPLCRDTGHHIRPHTDEHGIVCAIRIMQQLCVDML